MTEKATKRIEEHAQAINDLARQRDDFVAQANQRITEWNAEILRREGAILEIRQQDEPAPDPVPVPGNRQQRRAKARKR